MNRLVILCLTFISVAGFATIEKPKVIECAYNLETGIGKEILSLNWDSLRYKLINSNQESHGFFSWRVNHNAKEPNHSRLWIIPASSNSSSPGVYMTLRGDVFKTAKDCRIISPS